MEVVTIDLIFAESKDEEIKVTNSLWKKWNLSSDKIYSICFGNNRIKTSLQPIDGDRNQIILPSKIVERLYIPFPKQIQAKMDQTEIRLGPLIGLLTSVKNSNSTLFKKMLSFKDHHDNYTFVFTPNDVDWFTKTIKGTFRSSESRDEYFQKNVSIPDVIYNRIFGRKRETGKTVQTFYKNIELFTNAKIFNPYFFDKKTIHELLENKSEVANYLPTTIFSPSQSDILTLLKQSPTVFLKPKNGLGGRGIYKIEKCGDHYISNTERTVIKYKHLNVLLKKIKWRRKYRKYLAQQGISLLKYDGRKFDFRVNVNKNIKNNWIVTVIAGKVAGEESVTTHIRLGGKAYSGDELLKTIFKDKEKIFTVINDIEEAVIRLASAIESSLNRNIGEIGFDMGVDLEGKVWMIEANSKPGRSVFKHPSLKEADNESTNLLFEYAYYLSGFTH